MVKVLSKIDFRNFRFKNNDDKKDEIKKIFGDIKINFVDNFEMLKEIVVMVWYMLEILVN